MKARYDDIVSISEHAPLWWDENGVPRYAEFSPTMCADPDARQAALLQVACPRCRRLCLVSVSSKHLDLDILSDLLARGAEGLYGLLPHFGHCSYPYMASLVAVVEAHRRGDLAFWKKVYPK